MKTQFGKKTLESDQCVLCGKRRAETKEHIPPKGLFVEMPSPYLAVPACKECNNSTALADEDLRTQMAAGSRTEEGLKVYREKVRRKFAERPATKAGFGKRMTAIPADVPGLGRVMLPAMTARPERFHASVAKLVRGCYWWHSGTILGDGVPIRVRSYNVMELNEFFDDEERMAILRKAAFGVYRDPEVMRTFFYQGAIFGKNVSLWYFFFYRQNGIIAVTGDPAEVIGQA